MYILGKIYIKRSYRKSFLCFHQLQPSSEKNVELSEESPLLAERTNIILPHLQVKQLNALKNILCATWEEKKSPTLFSGLIQGFSRLLSLLSGMLSFSPVHRLSPAEVPSCDYFA